jgi:RAT1-interacting protein
MAKRALEVEQVVRKFQIPATKDLQRKTPYTQPEEVQHFSFDANRRLKIGSRESLSYFKPKGLPLDLNQGYPDRYITRDPASEHLDSLLDATKSIVRQDFCTWRGIITKIICTPYCKRDDWELGATLFQGTIYLEEHEEPDRKSFKFGKGDKEKLFTYYGYNFEALMTGSKDSSDKDHTVNTNVQFCSIFKAKLGEFRLLLGGEVDCILGIIYFYRPSCFRESIGLSKTIRRIENS